MDSLRRLEEIFAKFPGIGPRQAKRFVHYLVGKSPSAIKELTQLIEEVKKSTTECESCHRFFINNSKLPTPNSKLLLCSTCTDPSRDKSSLMIVARDSDFESIEKSGAYKGLYFILGGTVPILDKEPDKRIRLKSLLERVSNQKSNISNLSEIILSLNTTPEGEHTASIVKDALYLTKVPAKITILGRGLSTGAELEYADSETIRSALQNRH